MRPLPGQLSLFEVDACGRPNCTPVEAEERASDGEGLEALCDSPEQSEAERATSHSAEHAPDRSRRRPQAESRSLLSPEDVARRCGLSRKAVYRAVERGELRAARIRSRLRIDPGDLEAWVRANLVEPASPPPAPVPARLPASAGLRRLLPGT